MIARVSALVESRATNCHHCDGCNALIEWALMRTRKVAYTGIVLTCHWDNVTLRRFGEPRGPYRELIKSETCHLQIWLLLAMMMTATRQWRTIRVATEKRRYRLRETATHVPHLVSQWPGKCPERWFGRSEPTSLPTSTSLLSVNPLRE